ncbi:MAG TPA: elongation factor G [Planctomycetota bacterium]|nr:elongation factor G [Planctomycetota bacterium]
MAKYKTEDIRNFVLVGHGSTGKTTLAEAILFAAGATKRMGSIDDGSSLFDFEPDEKERKSSIDLAIAHCSWEGKELNVIDTPGYLDFIGEPLSAMQAVETVLIAVDASKGVEVSTRKHWDAAGALGLARAFVITKSDADYGKASEIVESLQSTFGTSVALATVPDGDGPAMTKVTDLLSLADATGDLKEARGKLMEAIVSTDDALLERYLGDDAIKPEELTGAYQKALAAGTVVPVFVVAARKNLMGVKEVLSFLSAYAPNPLAAKVRTVKKGEEPKAFEPSAGGKFAARVFKVKTDDYVGKISFFKVYAGTAKVPFQMTINNATRPERVTGFLRPMGKETATIEEVVGGDILGVAKIDSIAFGDTLSDGQIDQFERPKMPVPMVQQAIEPKARGDEQKIVGAVRKLADEDPTFMVSHSEQTKQMVISGMGQLHLDIKVARLASRFKVGATTKPPKIPYRETITVPAMDVEYTHKKQTGGSGQYARVVINLVPAARGEGYEFVDKIFGGAIDLSFRPSVDKGIQNKAAEGVLAGYPVVDFKAELIDGKTHPVDSKDIAFQVAGREAFKKAFALAKPVLIEPIVNLEVVVPSKFMGDITGDISGRRGRVLGMDSLGDMQVVKAQVPLAEVQSYSTELRGLTGGEGYYSIELSHYDVVPGSIAQQVIAAAAKDKQEKAEE